MKTKAILFALLIFISYENTSAQTSLWSMAQNGGDYGTGGIFKIDLNGGGYSRAHDFISEFPGYEPHSTPCLASNGKLYGMTRYGGIHFNGVLFSFDPAANIYTRLLDFNSYNGSHPLGSLIQASNGKLYGMTWSGGTSNGGVLFSFDLANNYTKLLDFSSSPANGIAPEGSLVQASNGKLYGMTKAGGVNNFGVLFSFDISSNVYTKLLDFSGSSNGSYPIGSLAKASNGKLYGMTEVGGINNGGVLFSFDPATNVYTKLLDFNVTNGIYPKGNLMQASTGYLYGTTRGGGAYGNGVLFSFDLFGNTLAKLVDFQGVNGSAPYGNVVETNGRLYGLTSGGGTNSKGVLFSFNHASAGGYTKLLDFDGANGDYPLASMVNGTNGKLYGMTSRGGTGQAMEVGFGVFFEFDPVTNVYVKRIDFNGGIEGANARGSLIQATNGKLYGMTPYGGATGDGVIFNVAASTNIYTKLFDFSSTASGSTPFGNLMQATNGKLYGMTNSGGVNNFGVIFSMDPSTNTCTKLYDFNGSANGGNPYGDLMQASNGKLYGMTRGGGTNNSGVLFSFNPSTNTYTKLLDFTGTSNGSYPYGGLMQASNGRLYGTTSRGGANNYGVLFSFDPLTNVYTKLLDLIAATGGYPYGNLMQANNGKLYGTTTSSSWLFSFDISSNTYSGLYNFTDFANGTGPYGKLIQASNGKLYGLTFHGGGGSSQGNGVLYSFDPVTNNYSNIRALNFLDPYNPLYSSFIEINPSITSGIITSQNIATSLCPASNINVSYTALGTYNPGNVFTAQLSNSTGSFSSPVAIGSQASVASGTMIVTIPPGTATGSGYRIRVVSSNPTTTGSDNGSSITISPSPPVTITANGSAAICSGTSVLLVANTGTGVNYQWQLNGSNIQGAVLPTYSATAAGNYTCVVTGSCNSATSNSLTVSYANIPPVAAITASGSTTRCPLGGNVPLNANTGTGLTYQWKLNGASISGATASSFSANAGNYTCVVSNSCGSATSNSISIAVDSLSLPPATITAGSSTTFCSYSSVMLYANTGAGFSYQWKLNGATIPGETRYYYSAYATGNYTCVVSNPCGGTTSNAIAITVNKVLPPTVSQVGSLTFCSGGSVTLNANVVAGLSYQWRSNGADIPGATLTSYSATVSGIYTCVVTNSCGSAASNAFAVTVNAFPSATVTAAGPATLCSGDSVLLSANTGTGLIYQWKRNGSNISGAVSSIVYAKVAGNYTCTVSKSGCSTTSNTIAVTVNNCLNMRTFFDAYYTGNRQMQPTLYLNNLSTDPTACDSITIELRAATQPYAVLSSTRCLVKTDGTSRITFPASFINQSYYIIIRHRGSIDVWSKTPVLFNSAAMSFDFTNP